MILVILTGLAAALAALLVRARYHADLTHDHCDVQFPPVPGVRWVKHRVRCAECRQVWQITGDAAHTRATRWGRPSLTWRWRTARRLKKVIVLPPGTFPTVFAPDLPRESLPPIPPALLATPHPPHRSIGGRHVRHRPAR